MKNTKKAEVKKTPTYVKVVAWAILITLAFSAVTVTVRFIAEKIGTSQTSES